MVVGEDLVTDMEQKQQIARHAQEILEREISRLRSMPYRELVRYLRPHAFEVAAPSGRVFQVEVDAVWDDRRDRSLRVMVSMDDSGGMRLRPFRTDDFIIAPDGSFVGEPNRQE